MSTKFYGPHAWMHVTHAETETPAVFFPETNLAGAPAFSNLNRQCACHRIYGDNFVDSIVDVFVWLQPAHGDGDAVFQVDMDGTDLHVVEFPDENFPAVRLQVAEGFELFGPSIGSWGALLRLDRLPDHVDDNLAEPVSVVRTEVIGVG